MILAAIMIGIIAITSSLIWILFRRMVLRHLWSAMRRADQIAGGILEVQPDVITVLSDTAIRGKDLDEAKASDARKQAEEALKNAKSEIDMARATSELAVLAAQIAALRKYRQKR